MFKGLKESARAQVWDWFHNLSLDLQDANKLTNAVIDDVVEDVKETADPKEWHSGDIDIALTRVLKKRLGVKE